MNSNRTLFFLMVDGTPVHPLVAWARDEIVRLETILNAQAVAEAKAAAKHKPIKIEPQHAKSGG